MKKLTYIIMFLCIVFTTTSQSVIFHAKYNFEDIIQERLSYLKQNMINHISKYNNKNATEITNYIFEASLKYNLNPVFIMSLIQSESYFKHKVKHKHNNVKGISGINYKMWKMVLAKHNIKHINSLKNQIEATAIIINDIKKRYKTNDDLEILHYYKGRGYDKYLNKSGLDLAQYSYSMYIKNIKIIYN
ncbi:endolysin [Campylobacter phage F336]|uniref:Endolysin n=1 Tax=Campylobacter phage F336 TaxID=2794361 RepID=A0A7T3N2N1_9CAUD|nr:endolysin [Campylobacter phage F336]